MRSWPRGGKYDFILLPIKSAAVGFFHQCQIKLMTWSARKQYYLGFWAFSQFKSIIFNFKKHVPCKVSERFFNRKQSWPHTFLQPISGNEENKHDEVTFQLAAVDLNSSALMVRNLCDIVHCDNRTLYSLGGIAGNDQRFEYSICASRHAASKWHWGNM